MDLLGDFQAKKNILQVDEEHNQNEHSSFITPKNRDESALFPRTWIFDRLNDYIN
jgi:hypothetical protein